MKKSLEADYQNFEKLSRTEKINLNRAEALLESLESRLVGLQEGLNGLIPDHLKASGKLAYNGLFYEYEQTRSAIAFSMVREDELMTLIETPVAGFRLSERITDGLVPDLRKNIKDELTRGFLHGDNYARVAKRLALVGQSSFQRAMRIVRTETGRVTATTRQRSQSEADQLGIELEKLWVATLDKRTRHNHGQLDGQRVAPNDYFEVNGRKALQPHMFGVASEDINCRCRTISVLKGDDTPLLRRDNETGEVVRYKNYREWEKAIDRRRFKVSADADYLKSDKTVKPEKGERESIKADGMLFSGRKVLNSKHNLYVSDNLGSARQAFSYYDRQIDQVMAKLTVPPGSLPPRFVLFHGPKDLGRSNSFGAYDPMTNTVFLEASKPNEKAILGRLRKANTSWSKKRPGEKLFAVDDDVLSPIVHELGHYKHYMHVSHHAKANDITYSESKRRFNEKLLEFLKEKKYNVGKEVSGYAYEHFENTSGLTKTNEIVSEVTTLAYLHGNPRAKLILDFLEKEDW